VKKGIVFILLGIVLFLLLTSIPEMPSLGDVESPAYNEVAHYYVDKAIEDTNATNVIASIITDYRAFDTLGETVVLFTSIVAVISVLSGKTLKD
jgi:multicomponent Na+:H+ antiporter subunit B